MIFWSTFFCLFVNSTRDYEIKLYINLRSQLFKFIENAEVLSVLTNLGIIVHECQAK